MCIGKVALCMINEANLLNMRIRTSGAPVPISEGTTLVFDLSRPKSFFMAEKGEVMRSENQ